MFNEVKNPREQHSTADQQAKGAGMSSPERCIPCENTNDHALYKFLLEHIPVGIVMVDPQLRIIEFNPRIQRITGHSEEHALNRYCGDLIHGKLCDSNCPLRLSLNIKRPRLNVETSIQDRGGKTIPVRLSTAALFDTKGILQAGLEIYEDLLHARLFERKQNSFVSAFAHDIKSPIISIGGFARRLMKKQMREEKQKEYLRIIERETSRLESLINAFLEYARLQDGKLKLQFAPVSLEIELEELVELYTPRASQKGITVDIHIEGPLSFIEADSIQLHQVFSNLLDNAIKFSDKGGTIRIRVFQTDKEVSVSFEDQGMGIDAADLPFLFEPFHRGKSGVRREGFGLGLSGSKAIIDSHGGRIQVKSEVRQGSVFTVVLPKVPAPIRG